MIHSSLTDHYLINFTMMHRHHYNLSDIEQMMPFERDLYVDLIQKEANKDQ